MPVELTGLTPLIEVFDMPDAIDFYCNILGFEIVAASPEIEGPQGRYFHWAWLRSGGADLMLNTAYDTGERPSERDAARWAAHSHTTLYIGCPDPYAAYDHLKSRGVEVEPPKVARYGMKQVCLRDRDGYGLCFQAKA
jgi:glyoxylase I family protein